MSDDAEPGLLQEQLADLKHRLESSIKYRDLTIVDTYENEYKHLLKKAQIIGVASTDVSALVKDFNEKFNVHNLMHPNAWESLKMLESWTLRLHRIISMEQINRAKRAKKPQEFAVPIPSGSGVVKESTTKPPKLVLKPVKKESILYDHAHPIEIQESLKKFRKDYPESDKVAFIMMDFGETEIHREIVKAIKNTLHSFNIEGVRADDKWYHTELYYNVLTYIYGCGFGIAVFELIEEERFNPNVSLEVGYMQALGKDVCLLKDKNLKTLHTDLIGKLYSVFEPHDAINTIRPKLSKWLSDKGFVN